MINFSAPPKRYTEKINRIGDLGHILEKILPSELFLKIQYVSIRRRRTWQDVLILIGLNNLDFKSDILNYDGQILYQTQKYLKENGMHNYEKDCRITKIDCFQYKKHP